MSCASLTKIRELNWGLIEHPPYSPDLAPSDYHLFRCLQNDLNHKKFESFQDLQNGVEHFSFSKTPEFFKSGIEKLVDRWEEVIRLGGDYIND